MRGKAPPPEPNERAGACDQDQQSPKCAEHDTSNALGFQSGPPHALPVGPRANASNSALLRSAGQHFLKELRVEGSIFPLAGYALLTRVPLQRAQSQLPPQRAVGGPVPPRDAAAALPDTAVQLPRPAGLDTPMMPQHPALLPRLQ